MLDDLVENSMLRGAWAEEIVAFLLPGWSFPGQFSYFDPYLQDSNQRASPGRVTLSVKHSTGKTPRFSIAPSKWAWDNQLAEEGEYEGWRGGNDRPDQRWCDVYVFTWLDGELTQEGVLSPTEWQFIVLSRTRLNKLFPTARTATLARLRSGGSAAIRGADLEAAVEGPLAELAEPLEAGLPGLDLRPYGERRAAGTAPLVLPPQQVTE